MVNSLWAVLSAGSMACLSHSKYCLLCLRQSPLLSLSSEWILAL